MPLQTRLVYRAVENRNQVKASMIDQMVHLVAGYLSFNEMIVIEKKVPRVEPFECCCMNPDCEWIEYLAAFHPSVEFWSLPAQGVHCAVCNIIAAGLAQRTDIRITLDRRAVLVRGEELPTKYIYTDACGGDNAVE